MTRPGHYLCASTFLMAMLSACTSSVGPVSECGGAVSSIHSVQGPGSASPQVGERVSVRGVVVGDFQRSDQLEGFFVQEPRADEDPRTSEGLFVFAPGGREVAIGDLVQVTGRVKEHFGLTELNNVDAIAVCERNLDLPPTPLSLLERDLEPYEGMLVVVNDELTLAGTHQLAEEGRLLLSPNGRPFQETNGSAAGAVGSGRRLLVDDGSRIKNPVPPPFLDAVGTRRVGDTITGLTGIITEDQNSHMLLPTAPLAFDSLNPRALIPPQVPGDVRVVSFNLLNFFTSLDDRGATDAHELARQGAKHAATISALSADVVGLIELENNEHSIRELVRVLNEADDTGHEAWAYVPTPAGGLGVDAIRVGIVYRPNVARPIGPPSADLHPVFQRPPVAQTFEIAGERFTVIVNHFKSKSCRDVTATEMDTGQGCWNPTRTRQARRLVDFVAEVQARSGDDDVLVIGDLNAYGAEDPIRTLIDGGLVDQIAAHVPPEERYSYVYKGDSGYLDHALTTTSMAKRVRGAAFWHINSDEPTFLDYNVENGLAAHYAADPFRSSDHDPVLIGLDF